MRKFTFKAFTIYQKIFRLFSMKDNQNNIYSIKKSSSSYQPNIRKEQLIKNLARVNKKISKAISDLLSAQKVQVASSLNLNQGFWRDIQRRRHFNAAKSSASWHLSSLKMLAQEWIFIQKELFELKYWFIPKSILKAFYFLLMISLIALFICLIFSSIMGIAYLVTIYILFILIMEAKKRLISRN